MMMLKSLLQNDLRAGILNNFRYFLFELCFIIFVYSCFLVNINRILSYNKNFNRIGFGDFLSNFFIGVEPLFANSRIEIPITWLCFHALLSLVVGFYITDDLKKNAFSFFIKSQSRTLWWSSKFICCVITVIIYYLLFLIMTILFTLIWGDVSIISNEVISKTLFNINFFSIESIDILIMGFLLPLISSIAISVFQMAISLAIKPIYAFLFCMIIAIIACFYNNAMFLFNFSMIKRYVFFISKSNINYINGFILSLIVIILSYFLGVLLIEKKDVI